MTGWWGGKGSGVFFRGGQRLSLEPTVCPPRKKTPDPLGAAILALASLCVLLAGCVQQMTEQPKYTPLEDSLFFDDHQSARHLVEGTVARGHLRNDIHLYEGKTKPTPDDAYMQTMTDGDKSPVTPTLEQIRRIPYAETFPFPITPEVLRRGQQRYKIYCSVCHGSLGYGYGKVVERGFTQPPSYHTDRLRQAPVGYYYDVITHGLGSMPDYSIQIKPRDRWAVIAYIRALQLSQHAELAELPEKVQESLRKATESAGGP